MKGPVIIFSLLLLCSCKDLFQFNPNEIRLEEYEQNLNAKNIDKLQSIKGSDTLQFIVIGDSQRFYDEVQSFVEKVNQEEENAAFVLLAGDITDFGLNQEFRWINERLKKLTIPYITVIGNHDMLGNGPTVYSKMFGVTDFSFGVGRFKFICHNTNSLETGYDGSVPNLPWLQQELAGLANYDQAFVISHIPPFDKGFDSTLETTYTNMLASNNKTRLSIHGHQHRFSVGDHYNDGVTYLVSGSMNKRSYSLVTAWGNQFKVQEKEF